MWLKRVVLDEAFGRLMDMRADEYMGGETVADKRNHTGLYKLVRDILAFFCIVCRVDLEKYLNFDNQTISSNQTNQRRTLFSGNKISALNRPPEEQKKSLGNGPNRRRSSPSELDAVATPAPPIGSTQVCHRHTGVGRESDNQQRRRLTIGIGSKPLLTHLSRLLSRLASPLRWSNLILVLYIVCSCNIGCSLYNHYVYDYYAFHVRRYRMAIETNQWHLLMGYNRSNVNESMLAYRVERAREQLKILGAPYMNAIFGPECCYLFLLSVSFVSYISSMLYIIINGFDLHLVRLFMNKHGEQSNVNKLIRDQVNKYLASSCNFTEIHIERCLQLNGIGGGRNEIGFKLETLPTQCELRRLIVDYKQTVSRLSGAALSGLLQPCNRSHRWINLLARSFCLISLLILVASMTFASLAFGIIPLLIEFKFETDPMDRLAQLELAIIWLLMAIASGFYISLTVINCIDQTKLILGLVRLINAFIERNNKSYHVHLTKSSQGSLWQQPMFKYYDTHSSDSWASHYESDNDDDIDDDDQEEAINDDIRNDETLICAGALGTLPPVSWKQVESGENHRTIIVQDRQLPVSTYLDQPHWPPPARYSSRRATIAANTSGLACTTNNDDYGHGIPNNLTEKRHSHEQVALLKGSDLSSACGAKIEGQMNVQLMLVVVHFKIFVAQLKPVQSSFGFICLTSLFVALIMPLIVRLHSPYLSESVKLLTISSSVISLILATMVIAPICHIHVRCLDVYRALWALLAHTIDLGQQNGTERFYDKHTIWMLRKELNHPDRLADQFATSAVGLLFTYSTLIKIYFWYGLIVLSIIVEVKTDQDEVVGSFVSDPLGIFSISSPS